jgi:dual specificity phosphatase 12
MPLHCVVGAQVTIYRCRKCRCLVATAHNVVETEEGAGEEAFAWRKRDKLRWQGAAPAAAEEAGGLFVEPLGWMAAAVGSALQGKLYCPK